MSKCRNCKIDENEEQLVYFDEGIYLCSLCNSHRGKDKWTYNDAWKYRFSHGYKKKTEYQPRSCYICGGNGYIEDIFGKSHANPLHRVNGYWECEYCKYDREVVTPRHEWNMAKPKHYNREYYNAYTFRSEGAGSGINPDKVLERIKNEREKLAQDFKRRKEEFNKRRPPHSTE